MQVEGEKGPLPNKVHRHKVLGLWASMGHDEEEISQWIENNIQDDILRKQSLNEFRNSTFFHRTHPLINMIGPIFGLETQEQRNDFFRAADNYSFE